METLYREEIIGLTEKGLIFPSKKTGTWTYKLNQEEREKFQYQLAIVQEHVDAGHKDGLGLAYFTKPEGTYYHLEELRV